MYSSKSGFNYLERRGFLPTWRNPEPRSQPDALLVHQTPLSAPLPLPALLGHLDGAPQPPDRGPTEAWPPSDEDD